MNHKNHGKFVKYTKQSMLKMVVEPLVMIIIG